MNRKKTAGKQWRLAGEAVHPAPLSPQEERLFDEFFGAVLRDGVSADIPASAIRTWEAAARASLDDFCRRCEGRYARSEVADALAFAVSLPIRGAKQCTDSGSVLLGAACWFLDYVVRAELEEPFLPLLPSIRDDTLPLLDARDLTHSRERILQTAQLLRTRKTTGRREFRKLLGLVRRDDLAALRAAFRDGLTDYFERFLEVRVRVQPEEIQPEPLSPLAPVPAAQDLYSSFPSLPRKSPDPSRANPGLSFLIKTPSLLGTPEEEMRSELFYRRSSELLSGFSLQDPYAVCAAYVVLDQEGDLLANLNTLTAAVLSCAERQLPWYFSDTPPSLSGTTGDPPDYRLRYVYQTSAEVPDPDLEGQLLSEPQLFYLASGCLLPRDGLAPDKIETWLVRQGLPAERAEVLSFAAAMAAKAGEARAMEEWGSTKPSRPEPAPAPPAAEPGDAAAERIAELNRQLKAARAALHEVEQSARQLREQLQEEEKRALQDRMELSGLRDTLFHMKQDQDPEEWIPEKEIQFPWQVRRRVLIFGGHDTWSKAIRPLLPGARFFDRESLPDLNAIKGADVVWIQSNALSHKFYYRIIDTARKEDIPVRYFGFASARKCAEQLVENECSEGGE